VKIRRAGEAEKRCTRMEIYAGAARSSNNINDLQRGSGGVLPVEMCDWYDAEDDLRAARR
jgi:hypothetical protein